MLMSPEGAKILRGEDIEQLCCPDTDSDMPSSVLFTLGA